jgi:hypothetical protein
MEEPMSAVMHQHPQFGQPQPWTADIYRKRLAAMLVCQNDALFRFDAIDWLNGNWAVYERFEQEANGIWDRGRTHYSHRTIWEYLRHETALREADNELDFKLNDHYTKDCARLYILLHPERDGFFEFRSGNSAVRAA